GEQAARERGRSQPARAVQGAVAEPERGAQALDERVLGPAGLDGVGQRVLSGPPVLDVREALAERVVGVLEVLGDVADWLLRGGRPVVVAARRNRVERGDQPAAVHVGEALEDEHDAVGAGCRGWGGGDWAGGRAGVWANAYPGIANAAKAGS